MIIDESQSGFVPDRLITNNVIIAIETFHWLQEGRSMGEKFMAVKLNMSKAYDWVEWGFLKWMLDKLNFPLHFSSITSNCAMSVTFQVLVNGFPTIKFYPKKALRQRNPLSPFPFCHLC